jgi:serine O-acetyltransferase
MEQPLFRPTHKGIRSRADLQRYLALDAAAHLPPIRTWWPWLRWRYPVLAWQRLFRKTEYVVNCLTGWPWAPVRAVIKLRFREQSIKLGFSIPINTFGPGLSIAHWGTIAVDEKARIGANCRIHQDACIGSNKGRSPQIGDNSFIATGAKIIGAVQLGDHVKVGANAVVTKSFGDGAVLVGIPARDRRGTESL